MSIDYLDWDEDDSLRRARSFAKDKEEHTNISLNSTSNRERRTRRGRMGLDAALGHRHIFSATPLSRRRRRRRSETVREECAGQWKNNVAKS